MFGRVWAAWRSTSPFHRGDCVLCADCYYVILWLYIEAPRWAFPPAVFLCFSLHLPSTRPLCALSVHIMSNSQGFGYYARKFLDIPQPDETEHDRITRGESISSSVSFLLLCIHSGDADDLALRSTLGTRTSNQHLRFSSGSKTLLQPGPMSTST